ncbi:MAG: nucleotidyltransferase family protein [Candidatus Omnitrophica bacterium]|nr:nucleotidyltransferase family protein [Candidatus Omnitrophota bacterium]
MKNKLKNIDVVILCGGLGKRLRPMTGEAQKTMAMVAGHHFLDILLGYLSKQGFKRVILCTGFFAQEVEEYYKKNDFGLKLEFSREPEPLGTGGAFKNAEGMINSGTFFGLNGDCFCPVDYSAVYEFHKEHNGVTTLVVAQVADSRDFGSIILDKDGAISDFLEKDASRGISYINAGIYCFEKKIFDFMPKLKKFSIETDVFPSIIKKGFYGFLTGAEFIDIGTPERFSKAQEIFKKG